LLARAKSTIGIDHQISASAVEIHTSPHGEENEDPATIFLANRDRLRLQEVKEEGGLAAAACRSFFGCSIWLGVVAINGNSAIKCGNKNWEHLLQEKEEPHAQ
jgi:hypothetical protein